MQVYHFSEHNPRASYLMMASDLLDTKPIQIGEWQTLDVSRSTLHKTHELEDVSLVWDQVPKHALDTFPAIDFNWAREHFEERVSGIPHNPAPSHVRWPYAVRGNADHTDGDTRFDHTYPERFWPKHAGHDHGALGERFRDKVDEICGGTEGTRFFYGDLNDVVDLLVRSPLTRQAYLPVWFPEDTGAVDGQRVPCTLGYHFMQRGGFLSCRYYIRSCDIYRHLSNDVFFAAALMHWICQQVMQRTEKRDIMIRMRPGSLVMHISSLHAFVGDVPKIKQRMSTISLEDDDEFVGGAV
jgi:thymidylate synthase-like protein